MKLKYLLILMLLTSSCGTILKQDEFLKIDSTQRNIPLYHDDKEIGQSPLLYKNPKSKSGEIVLKSKSGEVLASEKYKCSLDWSSSLTPALIPGIVAFPIGLALSSASLIFDFWNKKYFSCSSSDVFIAHRPTDIVDRQEKIILLPTSTMRFNTAQDISQALKESESEFKIIDYTQTGKDFYFIGIDETRDWKPNEIRVSILDQLAYKYSASSFAYLSADENQGDQKSNLYVHDHFNKKTVLESTVKTNKVSASFTDQALFYGKKYLYFRPNAISVGKLEHVPDYNKSQYHHEKYPNKIPSFLSLWAIERVSSPYLHSTWDLELRASPAASFPAFGIRDKETHEDLTLLSGVKADYKFGVNLHTPLGAFGLDIGPSLIYLNSEQNIDKKEHHFHTGLNFSVSYIAFFTRRLFLKIETNKFSLANNPNYGKTIELKSIASSIISIGTYLPDKINFW